MAQEQEQALQNRDFYVATEPQMISYLLENRGEICEIYSSPTSIHASVADTRQLHEEGIRQSRCTRANCYKEAVQQEFRWLRQRVSL